MFNVGDVWTYDDEIKWSYDVVMYEMIKEYSMACLELVVFAVIFKVLINLMVIML